MQRSIISRYPSILRVILPMLLFSIVFFAATAQQQSKAVITVKPIKAKRSSSFRVASPLLRRQLQSGEGEQTDAEKAKELMEQLQKLREAIEKAKKDLNENDLVKEAKLIELIWELLTGDINLEEFFGSAFEWPDNETQQEQLTNLLKKLFEVAAGLEEGEEKQTLEMALERACAGTDALRDYLGSEGVWPFLQGWFAGQIQSRLQSFLAKKLGTKAAGSIISILNDLTAFADALDTYFEILELLTNWDDKMTELLEILKENLGFGATSGDVLDDGEATFPSDFDGGIGKVTPVMWCYYPGVELGKGRWKAKKLKFVDGSKDKTYDPLPDSGGAGNTFKDIPNLEVPDKPKMAEVCYIVLRLEAWKEGSKGSGGKPDGTVESINAVICPKA